MFLHEQDDRTTNDLEFNLWLLWLNQKVWNKLRHIPDQIPYQQIVQNPFLIERHLPGIPRTMRTLKPRGKLLSTRFTVLQLNSSNVQYPIPHIQGMIEIPLKRNLTVREITQITYLQIVYLPSIHTALEEYWSTASFWQGLMLFKF